MRRASKPLSKKSTVLKQTLTVNLRQQCDVLLRPTFHPRRRRKRIWKTRTRTFELDWWLHGFSRTLYFRLPSLATVSTILALLPKPRVEVRTFSRHCSGRQLLCLWSGLAGVFGFLGRQAYSAVSIEDDCPFCAWRWSDKWSGITGRVAFTWLRSIIPTVVWSIERGKLQWQICASRSELVRVKN